jgi:hypothetical protein
VPKISIFSVDLFLFSFDRSYDGYSVVSNHS